MDYPLRKNPNFPSFLTFCFCSLKRRSSFLKFVKRIFLAYFPRNIKMAKFEIFDQKHGPTPLKECSFFDFIKFLFLQSKKAFFLCRISLDAFSGLILPQIKRWKNFQFFDITHGLSPQEKFQFWTLLTSLSYCLNRRFSLLEYRQTYYSRLFSLKQKDGKFSKF